MGHSASSNADTPKRVTVENFVRAETDMYMEKAVNEGAFGQLVHLRCAPDIDHQLVVRMNRDTLYSQGVFDLDAGPVTVTLPDVGTRYMALQVLNQDQYTERVVYAPITVTLDRQQVGTRYAHLIVRTLANPEDPKDLQAAHEAQDAIVVQNEAKGRFEIPVWDDASRNVARDALKQLGSLGGGMEKAFGRKEEVDPIQYLMGAAGGWGGNPIYAAKYLAVFPSANDGVTVHRLNVRDVPVEGFWSISVYNAKGYFEKNADNAYSVNSLTAKPDPDGSYTVQFGGCDGSAPQCLPIVKGWNYIVRLYRPRPEVLDGRWTFPEASPVR